jgi:hypothetical protein
MFIPDLHNGISIESIPYQSTRISLLHMSHLVDRAIPPFRDLIETKSHPPPTRWVCYEMCCSFLFATVVYRSRPRATYSRKQRLWYVIGYTLLTLLLGPWGIPWGIFHTLRIIGINLRGGIDVTSDLALNQSSLAAPSDAQSPAIGTAGTSVPVD